MEIEEFESRQKGKMKTIKERCKNSSSKICLVRRPALIILSIGIFFITSNFLIINGENEKSSNYTQLASSLSSKKLNSSTYVYPRVRFDRDFLPLSKNFQKKNYLDEVKLHVVPNSTHSYAVYEHELNNDTHLAKLEQHANSLNDDGLMTTFVSEHINLDNLTEDELIFAALDQVYKSRLLQFTIANYDNIDDRKRSSDKSLVNKDKCNRELDYLLSKLALIESARANHHQVTGLAPESAAFFDSYATEEAGLLLGNFNWVGNWRQCTLRHIFELNVRANHTHNHPIANDTQLNVQPVDMISFTGRYCVASIKSQNWPKLIDQQVEQMKKEKFFKYSWQPQDYRRFFRIQLGMCLPESCDSNIIETRKLDIERLSMHRLNEPFINNYRLDDLYCLPDESSELRQLDTSARLFVMLMLTWLSIMSYATYLDYYKLVDLTEIRSSTRGGRGGIKKSLMQKFVLSMSLLESINSLLKVSRKKKSTAKETTDSCSQDPADKQQLLVQQDNEAVAAAAAAGALPADKSSTPLVLSEAHKSAHAQESNGKNLSKAPNSNSNSATNNIVDDDGPKMSDLRFLDCIKVICMPFILYGHVGLLTMKFSQYPLNFHTESEVLYVIQAGTTFLVDWYFCMTGFIITYLMFSTKRVHKNSIAVWAYTIFHRYWRLAPLYILVFWYSRSVFQYTGEGPVWDYATSNMTSRAMCKRESWWTPITLTQNFLTIHDECIMPSWYIGNDMQFYLITPALLVLLAKSSFAGYFTIIGMMCSSLIANLHYYSTNPRFQYLDLIRPQADITMRGNWDAHHAYLQPQYRITSYLIGIVAGHYTYMVRAGKWSSSMYYVQKTHARMVDELRSVRASQRRLALAIGGLVTSFITVYCCAFLILIPRSWDKHLYWTSAMIVSTCHPMAAVGPAMFIVAIVLGTWQRLKLIMETRVWLYLSRINYFVYLAQVEFVIWFLEASDRMPDLSAQGQFETLFICLPLLYLAALLVTVLVENPLARLESEFVGSVLAGKAHGQAPKVGAQAANLAEPTTVELKVGVQCEQQQQASEDSANPSATESARLFVRVGESRA